MVWASGGVVVSEFFDKESVLFWVGRGGGVFFYKLTRNPNLTKNLFFSFFFFFFFWGGGGVNGRGKVSVHA